MRLLFASIHSYLDPSGGAALATREMLELLTARGMDCRALCTGVLDYERETTLDEVLTSLELPASRCHAELTGGRAAEVLDLTVGGVRVTLLPTASSRAERSPDLREGTVFLELADQVLDRFQPDVLLTYGGHPACLELMRRARARGIAVVFHLHNFGYNDRRAFTDVSTVIFPSEYSRRYHAQTAGSGWSGHPRPDPAGQNRGGESRADLRHLHQSPAVERDGGLRTDRRGAEPPQAGDSPFWSSRGGERRTRWQSCQ